ncbi:MAG: 2-succinyl-5-enolpyruvyl-6-hydroxy-3-cyclohexene-1-carboxylic-acid synthase [Bacteroidota bacterium]
MPVPPALSDAPNINHLWAALLVEELVRQGVRHFVIGPGSRSTPLTVAVANNPRAQAHVHIDERGGAFLALGIGRATRTPAAWITTSGTAVANGLPAAVEADASGVPLLLLTADRPPELRDTGANQTIRQPPLFRSVARWTADLSPPTTEIDPAYVLTTAAHAVARAWGPFAGPVHLNVPFREPLAPVQNETGALPAHLKAWAADGRSYVDTVETETLPPPDMIAGAARALEGCGRVLLVAGEGADPEAVYRAAGTQGWVLLADGLSCARWSPTARRGERGVSFYDLILASGAWADAHVPDAVVHVGERPTSKRLQALLDRSPVTVRLAETPERRGPAHRPQIRIQGDTGLSLDALVAATASRPDAGWTEDWKAASHAVAKIVASTLEGEGLSEPRIAQLVAEATPEALVVAASMPVRDLDVFAQTDAFVFANRGASGIDGTVSTAAGVARGLGHRATLLIGDLALLHDLNGLALLREGPPVTVVAINNDGGGIFHFLPVAPGREGTALAAEVFEPYFGTPHGLTFRSAAEMMGLRYHTPTTVSGLREALAEADASGTSALIEVRTDRETNAALHRDIARLAAEAVEAVTGL